MRKKPILPTALHQRFWDVEQVSSDQALFDKCDVVIGGWSFEASRSQVANFVPRLSLLEVPSGRRKLARLFETRSADDNRYSHTLTVRGTGPGESVRYPHPTFSGALKLRETGRDEGGQYTKRPWEAIFFAYLNLNRSLQSQMLVRRGSKPSAGWTYLNPYRLAIPEDARNRIRERLFAPSDNILDRSKKRTEYVQSKPAEEHLRDYVWAIFETVQNELDTRPMEVSRQYQPTITFQSLEVCWDFFDYQPILTVRAIGNLVQNIAQSQKVRYFPKFRMEEGLDYNSPSVMVQVVDGIAIRFYAKTETTIRFEVVYSQAAINKTVDVSGIHALSEAVQIACAVKEDAAERMNNLLACIHDAGSVANSDATVEELVDAVMAVADTPRIGISLLSLLAIHRRIAPYPGDPTLGCIKTLKRLGVLMNETRSPRSRNYVVSPRYRNARIRLASTYVVPSNAKGSVEYGLGRKRVRK